MTSRERPGATAYPCGCGYPSSFPTMSRCPVDPRRHAVEEGHGLDDRGRPRRGHETFTLRLSDPQKATLGDAAGTGMIDDDDPPLTASFPNGPDEHDGGEFVFHFDFSEEPELIYYRTLKGARSTSASVRCSRPAGGPAAATRPGRSRSSPTGSRTCRSSCRRAAARAAGDRHRRRPQAVELALGDRPRSGRRLGRRRAGRGGRRRRARLRGEPQSGRRRAPSPSNTPRRSAARSPGLTTPPAARTLTFSAGDSSRTGDVAILRRRARRRRGDADAAERLRPRAGGRRSHRHDREPRSAAARPACAIRAHGDRARGRVGRAGSRRAARARLRRPLRRPPGSPRHGPRDGARPATGRNRTTW